MPNTLKIQTPLWDNAQNQPWDTVNEMIGDFDQFGQIPSCVSTQGNAAPVTPVEGDLYFIKGVGSGAWSGQDNKFGYYLNGGWYFRPAKTGTLMYDITTDKYYSWLESSSTLRETNIGYI